MQYGFRPGRSTIDAILDYTEKIQDTFEKKDRYQLSFLVIYQRPSTH